MSELIKQQFCQHVSLKVHSDIYPNVIKSNAKCNGCGTRIKAELPPSTMGSDKSQTPVANIENALRVLLKKAIARNVPRDKKIDTRGF